jgi:hypothetical protein
MILDRIPCRLLSLFILVPLHVSCFALDNMAAVKFALGQVETGAVTETRSKADHARGRSGEVSRYQILPSIWSAYAGKTDFTCPEKAWMVTTKILADRAEQFRKGAGKEWDAFWLYAMWNAPGKCRAARYQKHRLSAAVRDRAQRFANLVESYGNRSNRIALR